MGKRDSAFIRKAISGSLLSMCLVSAFSIHASEITPYIVGGTDVLVGEQKWMATIRLSEVNDLAFCGATVINENWVLTAAHCVVRSTGANDDAASYFVLQPSRISITTGIYDLTQTDIEHFYSVSHVIVHPDYTPFPRHDSEYESDGTIVTELVHTALDSDLALLRVNRVFSDITPIELANASSADEIDTRLSTQWQEDARPKNIKVSGWGATDSEGTEQSNILQETTLSFLPMNECYERLENGNDTPFIIDTPFNKTKVCTLPSELLVAGGSVGNDSCKGDSGGPLRAQNSNNTWVQHGIVSGGPVGSPVCGSINRPSFYTRVGTYFDWIQSYMGTVPTDSIHEPDFIKDSRKQCLNGVDSISPNNCNLIEYEESGGTSSWLSLLLLTLITACRRYAKCS
jgi:secreted trypsin-like serine protease